MRVGVKFCGGCNPGYDRRAAYEEIRGAVGDAASGVGREISFEQAAEGTRYDALLVVCGCANRCASVSGYSAKAPPVYVCSEGDIRHAAELIVERMGTE